MSKKRSRAEILKGEVWQKKRPENSSRMDEIDSRNATKLLLMHSPKLDPQTIRTRLGLGTQLSLRAAFLPRENQKFLLLIFRALFCLHLMYTVIKNAWRLTFQSRRFNQIHKAIDNKLIAADNHRSFRCSIVPRLSALRAAHSFVAI